MKATSKRLTTGLVTLTVLLAVALMTLAASPQWGDASPMAPTAAEVEPNDNYTEANFFTIPGNMTGAITQVGNEDWFRMTVGAGQVYDVVLTRTTAQERRVDIYTNTPLWITGVQTDIDNATVSVSFAAQSTGTYYIRVIAPNNDVTAGPTDYSIDVGVPATPTNTPTNTATPTVTLTPTPTPLPPPPNIPIETEPNDDVSSANDYTVPGKIVGAITDIYDVDCFSIDTTLGLRYKLILKDYEFDRWLKVYDENGYYIMGNTTATNHEVELTLDATFTSYFLCVSSVTTASPSNTLVDYILEVLIIQPTPTPTPTNTPTPTPQPTSTNPTITPRPTWPGGFDAYEPNYDFTIATTLAPGLTYNMNFAPWGGGDVDNDFLKIRIKPGLQLTCETSELDPGVDPRMAFYTGPSEAYYIASNDDISLGNFNARLSYYATYEGYIYILVGQGSRMDTIDTDDSDYSLNCELAPPHTNVTPAPDKEDSNPRPTFTPYVTPTPKSPTSPIETPVLPEDGGEDQVLDFRLITTPEPVAPEPDPTGFRTFRVLVYFDANADGQPGAGEGIPGFFVSVLSPENKDELARGYTDDQGQLSFTVPTVGTVQVRIPLLGFDKLIEASKPEVNVRIAPPSLPVTIP